MNLTANTGLGGFEDLNMVQWSAADNNVIFVIENAQ